MNDKSLNYSKSNVLINKNDIGSPNVSQTSQTRRGMMDENYKNPKFEFTIQQKRYLESKLEKERNDREDAEENLKYKDVCVEKQTQLEKQNMFLKESLNNCKELLINTEHEKQAISKSLDILKKTLFDQNESIHLTNQFFEKRLERLENREKRLRESTLEWLKNIEQRQAQTAEKFENLINQTVKVIFQGYSNMNQQNDMHVQVKNHIPPISNIKNEEYKNVLDVMHNGISLPPCRKKEPSPKNMRSQSIYSATDTNMQQRFQSNSISTSIVKPKKTQSVIHSSKENKTSNLII